MITCPTCQGAGKIEGLTAREIEVMTLLADGKVLKEVARELNISFKTADTHKSRLMRKLNLHTTLQVVKFAVENGYVKWNVKS